MKKWGRRKFVSSACAVVSCLVLSSSLVPSKAWAVTYFGESRTYLQFRESESDETIIPLFEYLNLGVDGIGGKEISLKLGGWLRQDLADESFDNKKFNSDLQYAYLSVSDSDRTITAKLGRFYVFEGVGSGQVDGLYATQYISGRLGVSLYGGIPVETDSDGKYIYGGRISDGIPGVYTLGLSYQKEKSENSGSSEEAGADLWLKAFSKLELQGRSVYNVDSSGWQEHTYYLTLGPFGGFSVKPEGSWIDYTRYFTAATTTAFSFTPGALIPDESVLILGGAVEYAFADAFVIAGDYLNYSYDIEGDANYYGGKISYLARPSDYSARTKGSAGLSVHRMDGDVQELQYNEYRIYGSINFGRIDLAVDLLDVDYDEGINGVDNAYSASGALGFSISNKARIVGDIEYGKNPRFDSEVKGLLKFLYAFGT